MYKLHLILKYLLRRRIAWVALLAVTLCTTMVLVVISVMGGWLEMFKHSFHGLSGDIVVRTDSLVGFPYYQDMISRIEKLPNVKAATPTIITYGLISVGDGVEGVQVTGYPIDKIGQVNTFPESLYLQHEILDDQLQSLPPNASQAERDRLQKAIDGPPTFNLLDQTYVYGSPPADLKIDAKTGNVQGLKDELADSLRYDKLRGRLVYRGVMSPAARSVLEQLSSAPSWKQNIDELYDLINRPDESYVYRPLPSDVKIDPTTGLVQGPKGSTPTALRYEPANGRFAFQGYMDDDDRKALEAISNADTWKQDIGYLFNLSRRPRIIDYRSLRPTARNDPSNWPGMIIGAGLANIHPDKTGEIVGRGDGMYTKPITLTMLPVGGSQVDVKDMVTQPFWIVDDSRTKVWQYDNRMVYVPFEVLQRDLKMDGGEETDDTTGQKFEIPSRASEIDISVLPGANLDEASLLVKKAVEASWAANFGGVSSMAPPSVETWLELQKTWINAIENEKVLTVFLFGIISVVAIFLIFCIFYMIAVEKTRDIGIIKSVGATSGGVAGIFLGYGATIGIIGGLMGLLLSYLIVHNINWLHMELGKTLGIVIWNPEVYMFDRIPNTMSWDNIVVIVGVAIVASILGALIPALYAAWLNPVEALRFE